MLFQHGRWQLSLSFCPGRKRAEWDFTAAFVPAPEPVEPGDCADLRAVMKAVSAPRWAIVALSAMIADSKTPDAAYPISWRADEVGVGLEKVKEQI